MGEIEKMWGAIRNCGKWSGKWSDMVDVRLPEIISWERKYYQK